MIVEVPAEMLVIEWGGFQEAAEIMRRAAEFIPPSQIPRTPPKVIFTGFATVALEGLAAASWALTVAMIANVVIRAALQHVEPTKLKRRRTAICVTTCLSILQDARSDLESKYMRNRALETTDRESRKTRKFNSRK